MISHMSYHIAVFLLSLGKMGTCDIDGYVHKIWFVVKIDIIIVYKCQYGGCHSFLDRILFHHDFIIIFIMIVVTFIGIFMAINYLLIYTLGFLYKSSYGSANAQLPGCCRPWTFSLNSGLNIFPLDSFMSCLHFLLGCSAGEFQDLQLIVLAAFGAVD